MSLSHLGLPNHGIIAWRKSAYKKKCKWESKMSKLFWNQFSWFSLSCGREFYPNIFHCRFFSGKTIHILDIIFILTIQTQPFQHIHSAFLLVSERLFTGNWSYIFYLKINSWLFIIAYIKMLMMCHVFHKKESLVMLDFALRWVSPNQSLYDLRKYRTMKIILAPIFQNLCSSAACPYQFIFKSYLS